MVGPIPNPDTFEKKLRESFDVDERVILPGGKHYQTERLKKVNFGVHLFKHGKTRSVILDVFGCVGCRWVNTSLCPHRDNGVSHLKPHANRICSQRLVIPLMLQDEGVRMTGKQLLQVRGYLDADFFAQKILKESESGKRDVMDVFVWEKLKSDILDKMRRQDEGSKLTVKKGVPDPVVFAELLRKSRGEVEGVVVHDEEDKDEESVVDYGVVPDDVGR